MERLFAVGDNVLLFVGRLGLLVFLRFFGLPIRNELHFVFIVLVFSELII